MIDTFFTRIVLKMLSFSTWREFKNDCIDDDGYINRLKRSQSRPGRSAHVPLDDKKANLETIIFKAQELGFVRLVGNSNFELSG
jgi:hypothetical protein